MSNLKLLYFPFPGRAEVARLLLTLGKKEFEDKRFPRNEWPALKAQMPFGQVPVLYIDGKSLAQSAAIDRYAAKVAGLLPEDPFSAALADQAYFLTEDVWQPVGATFGIKDPEEQLKARQELLNGALADKLKQLSKLVESRPGKYVAGDKITHGDLAVFVWLSALQSGWLDGIPTTLLDDYPVLKEFRHSIATIPEIAAFYSKEDDPVRNNGFKA